MPRKPITENLTLTDYEDIFCTEQSNDERIVQVLLTELHAPEFHPFQVNDDEPMTRLTESIRENGVREPGIARPHANGGYELLCGNRRKRACELAGLTAMPVIIREMNDDDAVLLMVGSNLDGREKILQSEKAQALRMMMEALNHNGIKSEKHSYQIMVERTGIQKSQLFRIIRLTELISDLIDKVDRAELAFTPAVELSYLSIREQSAVAEAMAAHQVRPSLSQAGRLKKMSQSGELTSDKIQEVLAETKETPKGEPASSAQYRRFFPEKYTQKQMDAVIVKLLTEWKERVAV